MVQQARNLAWMLQDGELSVSFLLRDRDSKFTAAFDEVLRTEGVRAIRLPYRSPQADTRSAGSGQHAVRCSITFGSSAAGTSRRS